MAQAALTADDATALLPVYVRERRRILSNAACYLRCARQYGPVALDGGGAYRSARKAEQRQLAQLRANWRPVARFAVEA